MQTFKPKTTLLVQSLFWVACLVIPIQAKKWVVQAGAAQGGNGAETSPFTTISQGAQIANANDTVYVKAGIYRERVSPPRGGILNNPITYLAEPGFNVFIKGSDVWKPAWTLYKTGMYYAIPNATMFNDDVYLDSPNPFLVDVSSTPFHREGKPEVARGFGGDPNMVYSIGQVFVNGKLWKQVPYLTEMENEVGTWKVVKNTGAIYVNFGTLNPANQMIEISTRRRIFAPHVKKLGYITVQGFVMEHCGNQYPTNFWDTPIFAQAGALGVRGGHHWWVKGNVIRHANSFAIDMGSGNDNERATQGNNPTRTEVADNVFEENYILENGSAGIMGAQSLRAIIRNNVILRNNQLDFYGSKRWEQAGIKTHYMENGLIEGNYIAFNKSMDGVWMDNRYAGARITRNVIFRNGEKGVFLELSGTGYDQILVDNNLIMSNATNPIYCHDASGGLFMHNLLVGAKPHAKWGQGTVIWQLTNREQTWNHSLFNNIYMNNEENIDIGYPAYRMGPHRLDYNVYQGVAADRNFSINANSDSSRHWTGAQLAQLVHTDLGAASPGVAALTKDAITVKLNFSEWKSFWVKHGMALDAHSQLQNGSSFQFDSIRNILTLQVSYNPNTTGSQNHSWVDNDYHGRPIPQSGNALAGPFQNLAQGINSIPVWNKPMTIVDSGKLPTALEFRPRAVQQKFRIAHHGNGLQVDLPKQMRTQVIEIRNLRGVLVYSSPNHIGQKTLRIPSIPRGVYHISIR